MLYNFSSLIDSYGMIPNGNRIYFRKRSQPPLFISMVDAFYEETKDLDFIKEVVESMEEEFMFWIDNRTLRINVNDEEYILAHYDSNVAAPRPGTIKCFRNI